MESHARLELDAKMRVETDNTLDVLAEAKKSLAASQCSLVSGCVGCTEMHQTVNKCMHLLEETRRRFYKFSVAHHASVMPMLTDEEVECIRNNNGLVPGL